MMSSMLWALTIVMTFFLNPQAEASQGPGSTRMNAQLGVVVEVPFDMTCTFLGRSKKVVIVYRRLSKEIWEPKLSCNDGAGSQIARHVPVDGRDPRLMITGWYDDGDVHQGALRKALGVLVTRVGGLMHGKDRHLCAIPFLRGL